MRILGIQGSKRKKKRPFKRKQSLFKRSHRKRESRIEFLRRGGCCSFSGGPTPTLLTKVGSQTVYRHVDPAFKTKSRGKPKLFSSVSSYPLSFSSVLIPAIELLNLGMDLFFMILKDDLF